MKSLLPLFCLFSLAFAGKSYLDHAVYKVSVTTEKEHERVEYLVKEGVADPFRYNKNEVDLLLKCKDEFLLKGLEYELKITGKELQANIDAQQRDSDTRHSVDWLHYNTLDEIYEYLSEIEALFPDVVTLSDLAITSEGRPMKMLTVTTVPDAPDRPVILMDSGIHAREWITPATMTYFIDYLLRTPSLSDQATFYIIPVLNPDGYEWSWTDDRMWRKTRSDNDLPCLGVDGNRNFDYMWGVIGASDISCSDTYMGPYPLSEPEFSALADFMNANANRIKAYLTLHSYGQKLLYPWGHTTDPAPNAAELDRVAGLAAAAIESVYGTAYTFGSTATTLGYLNSGTSRDYALGAVNLNYTYTFELRDEGQYGFLLPENQILVTAVETLQGMQTIIMEALAVN